MNLWKALKGEFPRRPGEGEQPYYEPMMAWMDAAEAHIKANRVLLLCVAVAVLVHAGFGIASVVVGG